jgi:hypothetical protein
MLGGMATYAGEQHGTAGEGDEQDDDGGDDPPPAVGHAWHGIHFIRFRPGRSVWPQRMLRPSGR